MQKFLRIASAIALVLAILYMVIAIVYGVGVLTGRYPG